MGKIWSRVDRPVFDMRRLLSVIIAMLKRYFEKIVDTK